MTVIDEIAAERARQIAEEGHSPEADDAYQQDELLRAASGYVQRRLEERFMGGPAHVSAPPPGWPWLKDDWNPQARRRDLIKAAALIVAEVERMDRAG